MDFEEALRFLKVLGFQVGMFFAGLAGAWVSTNKTKNLSYIERASAVFSGGFIANYLTPLFSEIINTSENTSYGVAFIVGYIGMKSVEYILDYVHQKFDRKKGR